MPNPAALRRLALGSTAGLGVALLGLSFHGLSGIDTRLAAAAQARDAARTQLVVDKTATRGECDEREDAESASPATTPDARDY